MRLYFYESSYGLTISEYNFTDSSDYEAIWECEVCAPSFVTDPSSKERVLAKVRLLEGQIDRERAKAQIRVENLQEQVQELLALEYKSEDEDIPF